MNELRLNDYFRQTHALFSSLRVDIDIYTIPLLVWASFFADLIVIYFLNDLIFKEATIKIMFL